VACDVVVTVTPAAEPVVLAGDLRPGQHFAVLGADAAGKREVELQALGQCRLYCDEWAQASAGGELAGAVSSGAVSRSDVVEIGQVLVGNEKGRAGGDEITLFDSTGLAIQDLGIALGVLEAHRAGRVEGALVSL
jgi:ornithine cyclodeaminase/alanine dehydrogenase-like protein (mu-crystallin family)